MKKTAFLLVVFGLITMVSYQNCSQELGKLGGNTKATADSIPFPIDADIDTIARMSCYLGSGSTIGNGTYFSYKAIANNATTSGAKRSAAFDQFVATSSPTNLYTFRRENLTSATKTKNLQIQFSLKVPDNLMGNESGLSSNFMHVDLKDAGFIENLVNFDTPVTLSNGSHLSASIDIRRYALPDELYNIDSMGSHLSLTLDYIKRDDPSKSIGPATFLESEDESRIYGNKYKVYLAGIGAIAKEKYVSSIVEVNAVDGTNRPVIWTCERYKIIRQGDPTGSCGSTVSDILASGGQETQKLYKLLGTGWKLYSGGGDKCVRHETIRGCYNEEAAPTIPIEYNVTQIQAGLCKDDGSTGKLCANYLSVCSKNIF